MNLCVENAINRVMKEYKQSLNQVQKEKLQIDDEIIEELLLEIQPRQNEVSNDNIQNWMVERS